MNAPSWCVARILMQCSVEIEGRHLFSEEFVLLRGSSAEEVRVKAASKGESTNHSYANDVGEQVRWSFQTVLEVKETVDEELQDGTELYARLCSLEESGQAHLYRDWLGQPGRG